MMEWAEKMYSQFQPKLRELQELETKVRDEALISGAMPGEFKVMLVLTPVRQARSFGGRFSAVLR